MKYVTLLLLLWTPAFLYAEQVPSFAHEIQPILSDRCYKCHGPGKAKGKLRLDRREDALESLSLDDLDASEFLYRITTDDPDDRMPPEGKAAPLTKGDVDKLKAWMNGGAPYELHWAYTKPVRPEVSAGANPIDYFIDKQIESAGLSPNGPADPAIELRRLYLDLIGLPPSVSEVDAYLANPSATRFEEVVDRLLAQPQYGEKWARQWLDLARYADSNGFQHDKPRHNWPYRDWVIKALNQDMPFDQFSIEQLAGDLLPNPTIDQMIATAFHRNPPANLSGGAIPDEVEVQIKMDRVNTTGLIWLGATMECAACHDHRFDPISQKDYYKMYAYFDRAEPEISRGQLADGTGKYLVGPMVKTLVSGTRHHVDQLKRESKEAAEKLEQVKPLALADHENWLQSLKMPGKAKRLRNDPVIPKKFKGPLRILMNPRFKKKLKLSPQLKQLLFLDHPTTKPFSRRLIAIDRKLKQLEVSVYVMGDKKESVTTRLFLRGNYTTPGEVVEAGGISVLHSMPEDYPKNRLGLARWLVSKENPLTARVTVNRWWAELFGTGLVRTLEDFGHQGESPTHPRLLDWLATEFMASGWSMKHMLRTIVLSDVYRRDAAVTPQQLAIDPLNRLLARGARNRLAAESIRDNALAISGQLSRKMYGPPIYPPQPEGLWQEIRSVVDPEYSVSTGEDKYRRGVYIVLRRGNANPSMLNFDATSRPTCITDRRTTNTPIQALTLLNDPVYVEAAEAYAQLIRDFPGSIKDKVIFGFRRAAARTPTAKEIDVLLAIYANDQSAFDLAQVLLNLDETITK